MSETWLPFNDKASTAAKEWAVARGKRVYSCWGFSFGVVYICATMGKLLRWAKKRLCVSVFLFLIQENLVSTQTQKRREWTRPHEL